jgi:NAD(P)H dehydrogenase (quinone)
MAIVAIVYHSGYGHTEKVAQAVQRGAALVVGVEVRLITVEAATQDLHQLDTADAIIFGAPTYMGNVSAPMKAFMDASSRLWFAQAWKDKIAAGFTNSGGLSGDKLNTLIQLMVFAGQHGMVWVNLGMLSQTPSKSAPGQTLDRIGSMTGLMTQSDNAPPEETPGPLDLETAEAFGMRVAESTRRWVAGKETV